MERYAIIASKKSEVHVARRRLPINTKKQNLTPMWIILAVVVVVIGVFVYQGVRDLSGDPILLSQDDIPRVTVTEVQNALANEGAILLDVRTAEQYAASHVLGALSVPVADADLFDLTIAGLDKNAWYITYCT